MAGRQIFKYAELPIMQYRVFDSNNRQFSNVPIQPPSTFSWPPPQEEVCGFHDERDHQEMHDSDHVCQQSAELEDAAEPEPKQVAEEIEKMDDQSPSEGVLFNMFSI
jgi:hypothetical protein